jgi:hypothetical protein
LIDQPNDIGSFRAGLQSNYNYDKNLLFWIGYDAIEVYSLCKLPDAYYQSSLCFENEKQNTIDSLCNFEHSRKTSHSKIDLLTKQYLINAMHICIAYLETSK